MHETTELALFFIAFALYALGFASYMFDWRRRIEDASGLATGVMWGGFILHTAMIGLRSWRAEHVPILSAFEFVTAFAWLVTFVFLLYSFVRANRLLGVFLVPVILGLMTYASFMSRVIEPEIPIFDGVVLQIHIVTVLIAYASWAMTFAASVFYLYLEKTGSDKSRAMDRTASTSAFIALCFMTVSIATGALWADQVFGQLWFWDPKETWSLITWLIFLAYLHSRYNAKWTGKRAAYLAIFGFMSLVFTYVGVDFFLPHLQSLGMDRMSE